MKENNQLKNSSNSILSYIILGIFILSFLLLLLFSSNTSDIEKDFNFYNKIDLDYNNLHYSNVKIGNLSLENPSFFPKRVFLDNYVLCDFENSFGYKNLELVYIGSTSSTYSDGFNYNYRNFVEVSGKSSLNLNLAINYLPFRFDSALEKENIINENLTLYLFRVPQGESQWNYCDLVDITLAEKIIEINIK